MPKKDQERENEMQKCRVNYGVKENASGAPANNVLYLGKSTTTPAKLPWTSYWEHFLRLQTEPSWSYY